MQVPSSRKRALSVGDTSATGLLDPSPSKRLRLSLSPLVIPVSTQTKISPIEPLASPVWDLDSPQASDTESLFGNDENPLPAQRAAPPVPGLYFPKDTYLPPELCDMLYQFCLCKYFTEDTANQVMLFERHPIEGANTPSTGLPSQFHALLDVLRDLLSPLIPPDIHRLLFPEKQERARQAIINMYDPGEGITPHVDLLGRYGDGIIGVSLGSGCVMRFDSTEDPSLVHELYLPSRSILVLSGDARYKWTHGIEKRMKDYVASDNDVSSAWHERGRRISITLRWLLPGADVVGDAGESLGSEEPANF